MNRATIIDLMGRLILSPNNELRAVRKLLGKKDSHHRWVNLK